MGLDWWWRWRSVVARPDRWCWLCFLGRGGQLGPMVGFAIGGSVFWLCVVWVCFIYN